VVGVGLLAILFWSLDWRQFWQTLSGAKFGYVAPALLAYVAGKVLTAIRWAMLARPLGFKNSLKEFVAFYYIGMFFNLFAPSTLGGDAGKVYYLARETGDAGRAETATRAVISIFADRAIGMAVLFWIAAVALLAFPAYAELFPPAVRYVTYIVAVAPIVAYATFPLAARWLANMSHSLARKLYDLGNAYWRRPDVLAGGVVLSLAFHLIQVAIQVLIADALAYELPWSYALVFFPLVDVVAMLPVSISGIGLREGGYLFFLGRLGVGPERAIASSILWLAIVVASGLVGGLVFVFYRGRGQSTPS
jgi:uncharacterized membrane protein YbhN (UPF0104 family)